MTVKVLLIDILGRSVETSATIHDTLCVAGLPLLPNIDLILCYLGIKGDDSKLSDTRKFI